MMAGVSTGVSARQFLLVARREIVARFTSKAFLLSWLFLVVIVAGGTVISQLFTAANTSRVAVSTENQHLLSGMFGIEPVVTADDAQSVATVRAGEADVALVTDASSTGFELVGLSEVPELVVQALSTPPSVRLLEPDGGSVDGMLAFLIASAFSLVYLMSAVTFASLIAQSVVEEKQSRVVEILISVVHPRILLAGKIAGNSAVGIIQIFTVAAAGLMSLILSGQDALAADLTPSVIWFVAFFIVGFVLLAALFASAASLVSRQEDVSAVLTPVMAVVFVPYMLIMVMHQNPTVMAVLSHIPISAPMAMPYRIYLGSGAPWEAIVALVVMLLTTVVLCFVGGAIYERAVLRMGSRVPLVELLRVSRTS